MANGPLRVRNKGGEPSISQRVTCVNCRGMSVPIECTAYAVNQGGTAKEFALEKDGGGLSLSRDFYFSEVWRVYILATRWRDFRTF